MARHHMLRDVEFEKVLAEWPDGPRANVLMRLQKCQADAAR